MALLLAMYQKLRLIRQKNQLTLDLTKYSSKLDRVTKNIERVQKRYESLFTQLDSQAKMMQSNATVMFQEMANLGANSVNLNNYNGMNGFIYNTVGSMLAQGGFKYKENPTDKEYKPLPGMSDEKINEMMNEYMQYGKFREKTDPSDETKTLKGQYEGNWTEVEVQAFMSAVRTAQIQQTNAQQWVNQANQQYGNNVSIWLEAAKAQLEAEQDAVLEPLSYEETMMELEKTQTDAKLKRVNEQIETYDQLVSQEGEKTAPTFGLR